MHIQPDHLSNGDSMASTCEGVLTGITLPRLTSPDIARAPTGILGEGLMQLGIEIHLCAGSPNYTSPLTLIGRMQVASIAESTK